jgi:Na+/glutamate symporter
MQLLLWSCYALGVGTANATARPLSRAGAQALTQTAEADAGVGMTQGGVNGVCEVTAIAAHHPGQVVGHDEAQQRQRAEVRPRCC